MSGDVSVQKEKRVRLVLRSCIGEPRKKGFKFPNVLFPYWNRYRSPNSPYLSPGSTPRFPTHTHPKRWAPLEELSIAFFAYFAKRPTFKRNLYELMHTVPLRGAGSFFWRDGSQDAWKLERRKRGRWKEYGARTHDPGGQGPSATAAEDGNIGGEESVGSGEAGGEASSCGGSATPVRTPKLLVFSPREIFFKYRPFKARVYGRLSLGLASVNRYAAPKESEDVNVNESRDSSDTGSSSEADTESCTGKTGMLSAAEKGACRAAAVVRGRSRVSPPEASLGGWNWQPPSGASRWIFRPPFPPPLSAPSSTSVS